ncbi:ABC transporter permease [Varunaivibrio sulfuroxidans]|uniref:Iron(III) transport system permease protein n=1 Tax=Varunaivibrio sulfuroxidans TaxID=1773489 RepID=A0A4R3JAJ5_9PROT|nr:iron ABC transporter permease [Varunaivibrio sulfuroxidans]TCS63009.1 iron(III) transport system permease protein [Varunaivibrio sulfuroxidans]WES31914.1 iron ABC transporter permease [Varunaivibrio sulfuroxidans]
MTPISSTSDAASWKPPRRPISWAVATGIAALLAITPIAAVLALGLAPTAGIWTHLASTVLPRYIWTTLTLTVAVGLGTSLIGTAAAWLTSMCVFPLKRIYEWALLLPMAVPAYIVAYVYTDLLEYSGPVQRTLRALFGWTTRADYVFFEIRSLGGAIATMSLVLYPYVYLLARAAFLEQSLCVLEASRTLGRGPWSGFFRVALPLARPAIVVGVSLAMMETLNDYGVVDYFAVATFTSGIFDVWLNMNSPSGAAQLAGLLLLFVATLLYLERRSRRRRRFHGATTKKKMSSEYALSGWRAWGASLFCATPVILGFIIPAVVLGRYALGQIDAIAWNAFLRAALNSLVLSGGAALACVALGALMAYGMRLNTSIWSSALTRLAVLGYGVPGAVLALGTVVALGWLDASADSFARGAFGVSTGLIFSGTALAVIYAYTTRFLSLSFGAFEAGLGKITPNMDGAARTLGKTPAQTFRRVHLPLIGGSALTAAMLVFVDCMKELPMTLILRPFNFETLATYVHQYASDEMLAEAAPGALAIVAAGIVPVIVMSLAITRVRLRPLRDGVFSS